MRNRIQIGFLKGLIIGLIFLVAAVNVGMAVNDCRADDLASVIRLDVKEFKLDNGMLFLVVERPATPQVACRIAIRAGSALEETGKTGVAHMLEHMMFKGTKNFGTLDVERDQELQERIEVAYQTIKEEEGKREPDKALIDAKKREMDQLRIEVQKVFVPQVFSSQLGRNGAVGINAFTSKDQTQYFMAVPSDMLEQWFSIVSEQLFEPSWREFYVEKEVIKREWAHRYVNNPNGAAWLELKAMAYTAHPYRNPVIGWKTDMDKFSTQDAFAFHQKYYNPSNAVCVLVGDIKVEKAKELAKVYFERYPSGRRAPEVVTEEPQQQGPRKSIRFLKGARTPLVRIGFHAPPMGSMDFLALDMMTMVLSYGRSARMKQNITDKGMALRAWAANLDNRFGSMVILGGSPNEPDELTRQGITEEEKRQAYINASENLEKTLLKEIERLKEASVSKRELDRIKKLNQRDHLEGMRSNKHLAGTLATLEIQFGWRYLLSYLDKIAEVTPEDIERAVRKYIREENKTTVYVIPGGEPDQPPTSYSEVRSVKGSSVTKPARPQTLENNSDYVTPQGWKHPLSFERQPKKITYQKAETFSLGEAKVFYLPDRELPLVDLTLLIKAGTVDLDDSKIGLASLLNGSLIQGGTEKYSPGELALALDENAIHLSVSVGEEESVAELSVMKADWEKGLRLLEEVITKPRFDPRVLSVVKKRALTALKRQGGDAEVVSGREAKVWQFKDHPYGRDPLEGLTTIPLIEREDLIEFMNTYFVPSNIVVAVSGDIEKEKVILGLGRLFDVLGDGQAPPRRLEDPVDTPPVLTLIHKPGQVQSQVTMSLRSIKRTHPDYWKVGLLMNIFGGGDSLMYMRLRDDLGIVYSAGFFQYWKWRAGILYGYIGCKGDKTSEAIRETVEIMDALQKEVPEAEFERKRLDILNSFVFNVDSPEALVKVYGRYHMRNEPLDTLEMIQAAYISATGNELQSLARKFLDPNKLQIFVVADKTIRVRKVDGTDWTLEEDLEALAKELGIPFREIPLR